MSESVSTLPTPESMIGFDAFTADSRKTLQGIKNRVAERIYTCIATAVTKLNVSQVPAIIELARQLKVKPSIAFNFTLLEETRMQWSSI
jgi:MoaA/NifB/PqqE/SkfB family radical SAM enzyme